jgi:hypothetical protein
MPLSFDGAREFLPLVIAQPALPVLKFEEVEWHSRIR